MTAPAPTRAVLKSLPRPVWILLAGTLINRLGSFVLIFLILYLTDLGFTPAQAGAALSTYGIGSVAAAAIGGYLTDRLGRRTTIALSMFSAAGALLLLYHVDVLWALIAITGLVGFTAELYRPASVALLTDLTDESQRITVFAAYRLAINTGFMIGPALGGFLADRSFGILFYGDAVSCVVFGLIALAALPNNRPGRPAGGKPRGSVAVIARDRRFLLFLIASTMITIMFFQPSSGWALQVKAWGHSNAIYGMLLSLNGLLVLALELPVTAVTRKRSARRVIAAGFALMGIGFGLTMFASALPFLALTVAIWTLGEIINAPVSTAYVSTLAPSDMRGRYHGAHGLTMGVGLVVGPIYGTTMFAINPGLLWGGCLLLGLGAAWLVLRS